MIKLSEKNSDNQPLQSTWLAGWLRVWYRHFLHQFL